MKVLVSAAEASADLHASQLVEALRRQDPELELAGIGGSHLEKQGLTPVARASELAVMGSVEVLSKLRVIRRAGRSLLAEADRFSPDVAVLVDYPGFHFQIGPKLKARGIPVIYFIPPKVWVWRKNRLKSMKEWVSQVLCVLPFEPSLYHEAGIPAQYVGSPLVEELPVHLSRQEARESLGLLDQERVLAVLPGSRASEMRRHWLPFLDAANKFARDRSENWTVLIPIASTLDFKAWQLAAEEWSRGKWSDSGQVGGVRVRVVQDLSGVVLRAADLGLIKSGTATLEAGILECPMVIAYRPGGVTSFAVKHLLRYQGPAGLVNLFRGWKPGDPLIAPEVLHDEMTAESLSRELNDLYSSPERMGRMRQELQGLRDEMLHSAHGKGVPSDQAAAAVLEVARNHRRSGEPS